MKTSIRILVTLEKVNGISANDLLYLLSTGRLAHDYEVMEALGANKLSEALNDIADYLNFWARSIDKADIQELTAKKWITNYTKGKANKIAKLIPDKYKAA